MASDQQLTTNVPVGFRFKPTDAELIQCYLSKKEKGEPTPCDIIRDSEIYGAEDKEPWKLFGETSSKTFYVFTKLKKKSKQRIDRIAGCGTWKGQRTEDVKDSKNNLIGFKKLFVFTVKGSNNSGKGHWLMHEFSLRDHNHSDYVLCAIKNKKGIVDDDEEPPRKRARISTFVEEDHVSPTLPSPAASLTLPSPAASPILPYPAASNPVSEFRGELTCDDIDYMINFMKDNEYVLGDIEEEARDDEEPPQKRARISSLVEEDHVSPTLPSPAASPTLPYPAVPTTSNPDSEFRGELTCEDIEDMINSMEDNEYVFGDVEEEARDDEQIQKSGQVQ